MKFEYRAEIKADSPEPYWYSEVRFTPCCKKAGENHGDYTGHEGGSLFLDNDASVNIGLDRDDYFGGWHSMLDISFCPFCGAKVVTEEVERVEVAEQTIERSATRQEVVHTETVIFKKDAAAEPPAPSGA
jgi:hypothetical protein